MKSFFLSFTTPSFITFWHCGARAAIKSCGTYTFSYFKECAQKSENVTWVYLVITAEFDAV